MSTLRKWRSRPAAGKSPSDAAQPQPRDWGTKEVARFLEQQGLNAYAPAAKKSKLKGTHLLNAASTPFFMSSHISPPTTPSSSSSSPSSSTQPYAAASESKPGGPPQLRVSTSSPNFGTLARSKSFIFGPAGPRRNANPAGPGGGCESEAALRRLCDQLGVLSVVDKRRLWLALLMLQRQQDELQTQAQAAKHYNNGGGRAKAAAQPVVGLPCAIKQFAASEKCIALRRDGLATRLRSNSATPPQPAPEVFGGDSGGDAKAAPAVVAVDDPVAGEEAGRKRSSSFSSVPLITNSDDFFAVAPTQPAQAPAQPAAVAEAAPQSPVVSPFSARRGSIRRKVSREQASAAGLPDDLVAALSTSGSSSPTRKNRSSIGPVATIRKWITPAATAQAAPSVTVAQTDSPSLCLSSSSSSSSLSSSSSSSSSEEGSRATLPANPLATSSRAVRTAASSQRSPAKPQQARRNPTLTYAERHGVVVVKCCLQLSALTVIDTCSMSIVPTRRVSSDSDNDEYARSSSSGDELPDVEERQLWRKKAESTYYDDISLLRLDARRPLLYADLMAEVHRLHGPLLLAILMQEGAKGVVRISYRDVEGDLVGIQSDDALRYAYEDWRKQARRRPRKHTFMRLLVESTSPRCNK